jgi:hypothetical protein
MKPETARLAALCAVIDQDLRAVRKWDAELEPLWIHLPDAQPGFRDMAAPAYALHNIYNALENSFEQISRTFENHITDPAQWHKELLAKMFLEIPRLRPAVLPLSLQAPLTDLRGFRHLFRHAYCFDLDAEKLRRLVRDWRHAHPAVEQALTLFRDQLLAQVEKDVGGASR